MPWECTGSCFWDNIKGLAGLVQLNFGTAWFCVWSGIWFPSNLSGSELIGILEDIAWASKFDLRERAFRDSHKIARSKVCKWRKKQGSRHICVPKEVSDGHSSQNVSWTTMGCRSTAPDFFPWLVAKYIYLTNQLAQLYERIRCVLEFSPDCKGYLEEIVLNFLPTPTCKPYWSHMGSWPFTDNYSYLKTARLFLFPWQKVTIRTWSTAFSGVITSQRVVWRKHLSPTPFLETKS